MEDFANPTAGTLKSSSRATSRTRARKRSSSGSSATWRPSAQRDRKRAKEMLRDRTKDSKVQLFNAFAKLNGGKHNSAFRRIPTIGQQDQQ